MICLTFAPKHGCNIVELLVNHWDEGNCVTILHRRGKSPVCVGKPSLLSVCDVEYQRWSIDSHDGVFTDSKYGQYFGDIPFFIAKWRNANGQIFPW